MATTTTPNYEINYDDERFSQVEFDKQATLAEQDAIYQGVIDNTDKYYQGLVDESKAWADKQSQLQQDRTDFTIEQIEQQKDQAHKDYIKEQSGAYVDWQKQSNQYGVNAEKMASQGLTGTGFSESSQVSMYNTYQNRVATAREVFSQAVLNYDNAMKDAQLQNSSILAEIAHNALQEQLELSLQSFQYKNNLILEQANKKLEIDNMYYQRWQDVLNQMNTENALKQEWDMMQEGFKHDFEVIEQNYQNDLAKIDKEHAQAKERIEIQYQNDLKLLKEEDKLERQRAKEEYQRKIKLLEKETEEKKKILAAETEEAKKLLKYEQSLKQTTIGVDTEEPGGDSDNRTTLKKGLNNTSTNFDQQSVINAGYAGKSEAKIAEDVIAGKLTAKVVNGKTYIYKNTNYTPKLSNYLPLMQYTNSKNTTSWYK